MDGFIYLYKHDLVFIKQNMLNSNCKLKAPFPEPHFTLQERIEHVVLIKKKKPAVQIILAK